MTNFKFTIIITSFNEPDTIKKAINSVIYPNKDLWNDFELVIVAPDNKTLDSANEELKKYSKFTNYKLIKDKGTGKPTALNLAISNASNEILILTDGDVYLNDIAIKSLLKHFNSDEIGGISGQPKSLSDNSSRFGFYSNVFCNAAHKKRLSNDYVHMSGYVYAMRKFNEMLPIPSKIRSEDAYASMWLKSKGYKIEYEPNAIAYVKFPANYKDWMNQKVRSLGGAIQLKSYKKVFEENTSTKNDSIKIEKGRDITEDFKMALFPIQYASNPREYLYAFLLYPLRLWLWIVVYYNHLLGKYSDGMWTRIESTK